jgi:type IV pilus assembly protein PilB
VIEEAIAVAYRGAMATQHMEEVIAGAKLQLQTETTESVGELNEQELRNRAEDAPIVRLVNLILSQAMAERATDIHIEPLPDRTVVRYRVDGMLYDSATPPKDFHEAIVVRIKILSDMDVSERRVPLDGRFTLSFDGRGVDVRVSTLPTIYGEKIAMRLLDKSGGNVRLDDLGFESEMLETYLRGIRRPYGMVLISGPTGSGKTTTLYSGMKELDRIGKNITTLEDPVEYHLDRINQVTVNRKAGLTFATGLRSLLRQDPDVIMIGEVRDMETAELAVRSALTGHLVLSTVHANDAPATATRLVDIGIEPYLVASAVHLVMAQRLVRRICPDCVTEYAPDPAVVRALGEAELKGTTFVHGEGCKQCRGRGFRGRVAVFELLELTPELGEMVIARSSADAVRRRAVENGFVTLRQNAIKKVRGGMTTVDEALSVCTELF